MRALDPALTELAEGRRLLPLARSLFPPPPEVRDALATGVIAGFARLNDGLADQPAALEFPEIRALLQERETHDADTFAARLAAASLRARSEPVLVLDPDRRFAASLGLLLVALVPQLPPAVVSYVDPFGRAYADLRPAGELASRELLVRAEAAAVRLAAGVEIRADLRLAHAVCDAAGYLLLAERRLVS